MERELRSILNSFDTQELENLARSHYKEVIAVLTEAVAHYDGSPDQPINQSPAQRFAYVDVGSIEAAERISAIRSSSGTNSV